jgi:hypothetical protein
MSAHEGKRLAAELMEVVRKGEAEARAELRGWRLCRRLVWPAVVRSLAAGVACVLLFAAYGVARDVPQYAVEAGILAFVALVNVCVAAADAMLKRTVILRRAKAQIGAYVAAGQQDRVQLRGVPGEVAVKRGGDWYFTLANMLIPGDQVLIPRGTPVPAFAVPLDTASATGGGSGHDWLTQYAVTGAPGCK